MRLTVDALVGSLDEAYNKQSWHGTNLRGSIRGLSPEEACWRPAVGRHNIWEILVHAAYWKYAVRRRLRGDRRGSFSYKGSDWFPSPKEATRRRWLKDVALLESEHRILREAVASLTDSRLKVSPDRGSTTAEQLVRGVAAHDLYHAGQIQLLKKLVRNR